MSLFHPPAWFPPQLAFLWPIIWVQVLMLRAQIRAAYGRGVVYRWSVTDNLRVYLVSIEWMPGQKKARTHLQPASHYSDRLAAACDGRAAMPEHLRTLPLIPKPLFGRTQCVRFSSQAPWRKGSHLPLPET
ncbi:hypothetical protein [Hyphomonas jannaschiana]|uniref:Uncharacterized protein n=1 Tax=Hyphomonas jannaschiana VP2 TaxID=1280952 RepID=A0A059F773_9PROT|nr:hypothetical protein [Hyphomonas jannaschiana]KCZ83933.1 hypothetical protein HJA_15956 [Hyphomonas jannaschiana VP2]